MLHQNTKRTSEDVSKFCRLFIPGRTKTRKWTGKELFIIKWLRKNRDKSLPATFFIGYFYRIQLNYQWKWDIFFQCHFWRYFCSTRTKDEYSSILGVPSRRFFINFYKCPDSYGSISDSYEIMDKKNHLLFICACLYIIKKIEIEDDLVISVTDIYIFMDDHFSHCQ